MLAVQSGKAKAVVAMLNACANPFLYNINESSALDISEEIGGIKQIIIQTLIE
jgi:hypothetical protein